MQRLQAFFSQPETDPAMTEKLTAEMIGIADKALAQQYTNLLNRCKAVKESLASWFESDEDDSENGESSEYDTEVDSSDQYNDGEDLTVGDGNYSYDDAPF